MGVAKTQKIEVGNELPAINESEFPIVIKLSLPPDLYTQYEELATSQGLTVAELATHRLKRCANHSSIRSLYFSESHLRQLESILAKRPLETAEQAISLLINLLSIRVGDFEPIPITMQQAKRLHMGAYGGKTVQDHIRKIVQTAISVATGL